MTDAFINECLRLQHKVSPHAPRKP
jgi:hypothetical protein